MDQAPKQKSPDELRAEELRRTIDQAAKENREAREKLEAFMKAEGESAGKPASVEQNTKEDERVVLKGAEIEKIKSTELSPAESIPTPPASQELVPIPRRKRQEINVTPIPSGPTIVIPPEPAPVTPLRIEPTPPRIKWELKKVTPPPPAPPLTTPERQKTPSPITSEPPTPTLVLPRRPKTPAPPQTPPTPIPQPPQEEEPRWKRFLKRWWKFGVAGVAVGAAGTYIGNKTSEKEDMPPTPAVSPMTQAELEARLARARAETMLETERRLAESARAAKPENQTINTTNVESVPDNKTAEEIAKMRTQMAEMSAKHQAELDAAKALREKIQADLQAQKIKSAAETPKGRIRGSTLTPRSSEPVNTTIQKNWPERVNMGGFIVPGDPNNPNR